MQTATIARVKAKFNEFLRKSSDGPVVVTRNGKPVAVLLGVQNDEDLENIVLAHSPRLREILNQARPQIREGAGIPH